MDFDGDGILDLISGSYDPGELYLFRGEGKGKFKARETITDKSGKAILRVPEQKHRVESFDSWPAMVDWENDGDLDILIGGFDGSIVLRINEGIRRKQSFACQARLDSQIRHPCPDALPGRPAAQHRVTCSALEAG